MDMVYKGGLILESFVVIEVDDWVGCLKYFICGCLGGDVGFFVCCLNFCIYVIFGFFK